MKLRNLQTRFAPRVPFCYRDQSQRHAPRVPSCYRDQSQRHTFRQSVAPCLWRSHKNSRRYSFGGTRCACSRASFADSFPAPPGSLLKQQLSVDGRYRVRPIRSEEVPAAAEIVAEAFFEPLPLGPFNNMLYFAFQAEMLSVLRQKLKYQPQDGFVCLVAESVSNPDNIAGVVDVSLQSGKPELRALQEQGMEELVYAYVACMAVRRQERRKGIASALLKAAEIQAGKWKQNWVLLHVYSSNLSGVSLYLGNGYAELYRDPSWQQAFGRRQRLLLAKGAAVTGADGAIQSISQSVYQLFQQQQQQ